MTIKSDSNQKPQPLISRYNGKGLLYAFVYRIAQRRILAELKRRGRGAVSIDGTELNLAGKGTDHESLNDVRAALADILAHLSDRERIVLRMTCDGCSNSEIARQISSPGKPPIHDGRVSHIRNEIVTRIREGLGILAETVPHASTLISDLLNESPVYSEASA